MSIKPDISSHDQSIATSILFVDDEQKELKYFRRALQKDFSILTSTSVDDAIVTLENYHEDIAIVISDQKMPVKHGMELLKYVHLNHPHIIRMLTTAYCDLSDSIDAINTAEVFRYIPKPWDLDTLTDHLNQAMTRYNQNINQYSVANLESILQEFQDDCQHWLMYALHAYGDTDIYKGGIEALTHNFIERIHKLFDLDQIKQLSTSVNEILETQFLNESTLLEMEAQSSKGFGTPGLFSKNRH